MSTDTWGSITEPGTGAPLHDNAPDDPLRKVGVRTLSDVTRQRISWLWHRRLPIGKVVVLDGDPSVGKSTLTSDIAARVSAGKPWPDGAEGCEPADVLLMSAEDGLGDTVRPRLEAAGADLTRIHALCSVPAITDDGESRQVPPSLPRDLPRIEAIIRRHGVKLVVVDVLMAYLDGRTNSNSDQDVRGVLHQVADVAERTGCCIILIRHLNKSGGSSPLYRGGGSIGIIGAARVAFIVARDPEDHERRILAVSKINIDVEPPSLAYRLVSDEFHGCARIEWEANPVEHTAAQLLSLPVDEEERSERDAAVEWLENHLEQNGWEAEAKDVKKAARAADIAERTLQRARQRLGVQVERSGFPARSVWKLPASGSSGATVVPVVPPLREGTTGTTGGTTGAAGQPPCRVCGFPMEVITLGQTTHPACAVVE